MSDPKDIAAVALSQIRDDIREIKRQLEGDPAGRYLGLWARLERDEARIEALERAWQSEQADRRVTRAYRVGAVAGLSLVAATSGGSLYGVYRVLQLVAGGGP